MFNMAETGRANQYLALGTSRNGIAAMIAYSTEMVDIMIRIFPGLVRVVMPMLS